ncbi:MAG: hypothetical protein MR762_08990, partial [Clostridiales bacterium]|nr:hypothetical protein [Clostridiales bacterium]
GHALSRQPANAGGWSYQAQNVLARARSKSECVHDYFFKSGLDKGTIIENRMSISRSCGIFYGGYINGRNKGM